MKSESQKSLRALLSSKRKQLTLEEVANKSHQVITRFLSRINFGKDEGSSLCVGIYRALPFELDLKELESEFRKRKCRLAFPRTQADRSMDFVEVTQLDDPHSWVVGTHGVQEPHTSLSALPPDALDLIFVPGVGFGKTGHRIGRGAGYYDRYLARAPRALRVALAFDFQYIESPFELQEWDQPVHWLITESHEYKFSGLQERWVF